MGFSKEDRDTNIRRIGFVAAEIVRHGGIVLLRSGQPLPTLATTCATWWARTISSRSSSIRRWKSARQRDTKGMYAKARRGEIKGFTGIDDPYEPPLHPEITLNTTSHTPEENAGQILDYLIRKGFVKGSEIERSSETGEARVVSR